MRDRKELIQFSKGDLEQIAKSMARLRITGNLFMGQILEQIVQWTDDGGISIFTTYTEETLDHVYQEPPMSLAAYTDMGGKKKKHK